MTKRNLVLSAVVLSLGVVYLFKDEFFKKDWNDRKGELITALSTRFQQTGAPTIEVADKTAACVSDLLVTAAKAAKCSTENPNVLEAMKQCIASNPEIQSVFALGMATCIAESLQEI